MSTVRSSSAKRSLLFIIFLIVAVVAAVLLSKGLGQSSTDNRTKASFTDNVLPACLKACDAISAKNQGTCKSDCLKLLAQSITCEQICVHAGGDHAQKGQCLSLCKNPTSTKEPSARPATKSTPTPVSVVVQKTTQQVKPTYTRQIFSSVDTTSGVVYLPSAGQRLDIFTPKGDATTNRPAIILIHGGGFGNGKRTDMQGTAIEFSKYGFVAFSIDYRLCKTLGELTWTNYPTQEALDCVRVAREDTESALAWVRANAGTYGVDPNKVILAGVSAGAVDAQYVGLIPLTTTQPPLAIVSDAGAILRPDLSTIKAGGSPVLFLHGSEDKTVPTGAAKATYTTITNLGIPAQWQEYQGLGHVVPINFALVTKFLSQYINSTP